MNLEQKADFLLQKREEMNATRKEFADFLDLNKNEDKLIKIWETKQQEIPDFVINKLKNSSFIAPFKDDDKNYLFTQIDLFAGIGGIRMGFQNHGGKTVFSSEWDKFAQKTYKANYGEEPAGDITQINPKDIPDHDVLLAGFPCQPFSQAGLKLGFEDTRGTLFFNIASILKEKRPKAFMLENVKQLRGHDKGKTLKTILNVLREMDYYVPEPEVLNAYHFGVPQNRERIFIVGFDKTKIKEKYSDFEFPKGKIDPNLKVADILMKPNEVNEKFTISDKLFEGHKKRRLKHKENGNGFGFNLIFPESKYTNTISARYYKDGSESLISQEGKNPRMLTPRECARLQGFPENFIIQVSNAQAYKQFGNSVCVKVIDAIAKEMVLFMKKNKLI
ncbi:DNA cytosine methyltransferase [Mycoplasma procyoni]|uniref:DNA cytosine methyltransferase n=1 Tax=Mycoplasma procyoni TaxID=568784 RepID=UPI00280AA7FE|nr:DNA (cytosine-5-)-methyltransferase [Mycoplasma procyoni]